MTRFNVTLLCPECFKEPARCQCGAPVDLDEPIGPLIECRYCGEEYAADAYEECPYCPEEEEIPL